MELVTEPKKLLETQEVKDYLGIDWVDEALERRLTRIIEVADKFLEGAIGTDYPKDDVRAQELALMIIADLYDHRELTKKEQSVYRKLAHDFELQIKLEMRV